VPAEEALNETIVFELRDRIGGEGLWEQLRPRWFGGIYECDETTLVAVELRPEEGDLSALLGAVELWVRNSGLASVRFHLDRRAYVLRSERPVWPVAAA
jgi:hypothetical protein